MGVTKTKTYENEDLRPGLPIRSTTENRKTENRTNKQLLDEIFVTTALARGHYCNHVRFPNVS